MVKKILDADEKTAESMLSRNLLHAFVIDQIENNLGRTTFESWGFEYKHLDGLDGDLVLKVALLCMAHEDDGVQDVFMTENGINLRELSIKATNQIKAEVTTQIAALKAAQKTPPPKSPLAQPSATPVADAENPKPKTPKPKAKPKLSAEDAQLGIAEAMQGIEAPPADGAGAVPLPASQFNKGQQVVVKAVSTQHAVWRQKYEGMTGTVKALNFDCALNMNLQSYEVSFKGRTGGVADFTADELEAA
jgi:hypothetical protein